MRGPGGGTFTISLDLELFWGVHDKQRLGVYRRDARRAREAIPRLLELFDETGVRCTWAVVGLLFFDDREELLAHLPARRPQYRRPGLSPYRLLAAVGRNEGEDPCHYGLSLVKRIRECRGQEIGTHTFSHYYCLEDGQTPEEFHADLAAAQHAARRIGITMRSLVFPRNQVAASHLDVARAVGLTVYRGNERSWLYRAGSDDAHGLLRRAGRLADSYVPMTGRHCLHPQRSVGGMIEVPSSRLLRRRSRRLRSLEWLRLKRIKDDMSYAAWTGTVFHLWFHPDGFGADVDGNLAVVRVILDHFVALRDRHGMQSGNMADLAAGAERPAPPRSTPLGRPPAGEAGGPHAGTTC